MVLERLKQWFETYYRNRRIRRSIKFLVVVFAGVGYVASQVLLNVLPLELLLLIGLILVLTSLEIIETGIYDIEENLGPPVRVFKDNYQSKGKLTEVIESKAPANAYIIAYSGSTDPSQSTLGELFRENCQVRLMIKNPNKAVNTRERRLIVQTLERIYEFDRDYEDIEIQFYNDQASVKATKFADTLLVSWYTFAENRGRLVWGHRNPAIWLTSGERSSYPVLNDWYMQLYYDFWTTGTTPAEMVRSDDCPEELLTWLDEPNRERREEWLDTVSNDSYDSIESLFPEYNR